MTTRTAADPIAAVPAPSGGGRAAVKRRPRRARETIAALDATPLRRSMPFIVGLLALGPHAAFQPVTITAIVAAVLVYAFLVQQRHVASPPTLVHVALTIAGGAAVWVEYGILWGQTAGSALLVIMTALKLLESRQRRDYEVFLFLGYFVVVTVYFFDQSVFVALWSLFAAWWITTTLVLLNGAASTPLRRVAGRAATMLLHALPIMAILFVVFPRIQGAALNLPNPATTGQTGLSESMAPGEISELLQREGTVARVQFDTAVPPSSEQYWRTIVLSDFDGRRWRRATYAGEPPPLDATAPGAIGYSITLESSRLRQIPLLERVVAVPDGVIRSANSEVRWPQPIDRRIRYEAQAVSRMATESEPAPLSDALRERYLNLPDGFAAQARRQARLWRAEHGNDNFAVIDAALARFRGAPYRYTLRPPRLEGDVTDEFLFDTQAGFCEHYASAFAVLMRAAGIPARVVTGYQGGQWNDRGQYLSLRYADAHAWTELWLGERGWVRVDPTAAIAPERIERTIDSLLFDNPDAPDFLRWNASGDRLARLRLEMANLRDWVEFRWTSLVLAYDPERQRELFARFGLDATDWRNVLTALLSLVALGVTIILSFGVIAMLRHRATPTQRELAKLRATLRRWLAVTGADRDTAQPMSARAWLHVLRTRGQHQTPSTGETREASRKSRRLPRPDAPLHRVIDAVLESLARSDEPATRVEVDGKPLAESLRALQRDHDRLRYGPADADAAAERALRAHSRSIRRAIAFAMRSSAGRP